MTRNPPPPGASGDEIRAYYEQHSPPRPRRSTFTDAQRALLADGRCAECGQPSELMVAARLGVPARYYDFCRDCRRDRARAADPVRHDCRFRNNASVGGEFRKRLGYGTVEGAGATPTTNDDDRTDG